jgi:hypothetical protein
VSFLPKERMGELDDFLADVVLGGNKPVWDKLFSKLGHLFNRRFGPDWKERNQFFKAFEAALQVDIRGGRPPPRCGLMTTNTRVWRY